MTSIADAPDASERLIYPHEAALELGVDVATLERWHARRHGPPVAVTGTGSIAYWSGALEEWKNQLGGHLESAASETLVRLLPDGCYLVRVLRTGATGRRIRFEVRRGRHVLRQFACLADLRGYLALPS